jgi:ABC-type transport system involved in cytochrome c biogenesis permease subunit
MALLAVFLLRGVQSGKISLLLFAHIFSVTAGYTAAFLIGTFGICYLCWDRFDKLSRHRRQALGNAIVWFSPVSAGLIAAALLTGSIWSAQNLGTYWGGDPREVGALCAMVWFIVIAVAQRFDRVGARITMLMCIGGNLIVGLAWFGASLITSKPGMYGAGSYWLFAVILGINLCFLAMGIIHRPEATETPTQGTGV